MSARRTEEWLTRRLGRAAQQRPIQAKSPKRNKYRAIKTEVEGIIFDSKKESRRWLDLRLLEKAGKISNLQRQVKFSFDIEGFHICNMILDFTYEENGEVVTEDVKSVATKTRAYVIKKNLLKALYRLDVRET